MSPLRLALATLTRLRLGSASASMPSPENMGASTAYFPLVGWFLGFDLLVIRQLTLLDPVSSHAPLWSFLILIYWIWSADSLHLDGLADTIDGLASRRSGRELLAVMHDSRIGTFGALGLVFSVLFKFIWLNLLPQQLFWALPLPLALSRLHLSLACQLRPYAGEPGSWSSAYIEQAQPRHAHTAWAHFLGGLALWSLLGLRMGWCRWQDLAWAAMTCSMALVLGAAAVGQAQRRLGGISGDLLGYGQQISEAACALMLAFALLR